MSAQRATSAAARPRRHTQPSSWTSLKIRVATAELVHDAADALGCRSADELLVSVLAELLEQHRGGAQ